MASSVATDSVAWAQGPYGAGLFLVDVDTDVKQLETACAVKAKRGKATNRVYIVSFPHTLCVEYQARCLLALKNMSVSSKPPRVYLLTKDRTMYYVHDSVASKDPVPRLMSGRVGVMVVVRNVVGEMLLVKEALPDGAVALKPCTETKEPGETDIETVVRAIREELSEELADAVAKSPHVVRFLGYQSMNEVNGFSAADVCMVACITLQTLDSPPHAHRLAVDVGSLHKSNKDKELMDTMIWTSSVKHVHPRFRAPLRAACDCDGVSFAYKTIPNATKTIKMSAYVK